MKLFMKLFLSFGILLHMLIHPLMVLCLVEGAYLMYLSINVIEYYVLWGI